MSIRLKCLKAPLLPEIDNWQYITAVIRMLYNFFGSNFLTGGNKKNKNRDENGIAQCLFRPHKKTGRLVL